MPTSARELVGWTGQRWKVIQDAVEKALAGTARCRQVVPLGPQKLGEKAVVVPNIGAAPPFGYGPDIIASPIHIYADVTLDDQHSENEAEISRVMEVAAAQVGVLEDQEIVNGPVGAPAPVAPGAAAPACGRFARNPALVRMAAIQPGAAAVAIGAGGANPNGNQLYAAITNAVAGLEAAGRPGAFGLLVHNTLMATLRQPRVPGGVPLIQEVEGLIGTSAIVGTSALAGDFVPGNTGGILFRLEPTAMDLVLTELPSVTVLGRNAGSTNLRVEEEIVLRVLDPAAVQLINY
jgi:hypothetical protein